MEDSTSKSPLVSIIVITYNSSKYVLETLESCKIQTYKNIELIISDDASTDDTLDKCREWLSENEEYFVDSRTIESDINTGIAPNCNRGLSIAKGDWIKFIAGDDILLKDCIKIDIGLSNKTSAPLIFSQPRLMNTNNDLKELFYSGYKISKNNKVLYKKLLKHNILSAPTSFIKKDILFKLGGFDERFPMYEDHPMWIKAIKEGFSIYVSNDVTVMYRNNQESISFNKNKGDSNDIFYSNLNFHASKNNFYKKILIKENIINYDLIRGYDLIIDVIQFHVILLFNNKKSTISNFIYNILNLLRPSYYYGVIKGWKLNRDSLLKL